MWRVNGIYRPRRIVAMKNSSIKYYISASEDDNEELMSLIEESFIGPKKNWTASQLKAINGELPILLAELREEYNDVPNDIGKAENSVEIVLNGYDIHGKLRLKERYPKNQDESIAQEYVVNAFIMFNQGNRKLFVSDDGSCVILDESKQVHTLWQCKHYKPWLQEVVRMVRNHV
jgi:hypothetical protein